MKKPRNLHPNSSKFLYEKKARPGKEYALELKGQLRFAN